MRVVETFIKDIIFDQKRQRYTADVTFGTVDEAGSFREISLKAEIEGDRSSPLDKPHLALVSAAVERLQEMYGPVTCA